MKPFSLRPVDRIEVSILVDNYIDIFVQPMTSVDQRLPLNFDRHIQAEHGFSCLVRIFSGYDEHTILLDTGLSRDCMSWNASQMGISLHDIEAVILSHGHFDHIGGLEKVLIDLGHEVPLIAHPDAFIRRRMRTPGGFLELPGIDIIKIRDTGADIRMKSEPSPLAEEQIMVTGEIERVNSFETGMPGMERYDDGTWIPDLIRDDQALVVNVKNKGLVILSGCAHAGIINTVEYVRKITGIDHVHAVLGGFHLTGSALASRIQPTIDEMKRINPDFVVPMHCTGWDAITRFTAEMPGKVILNTVGTRYSFTSC